MTVMGRNPELSRATVAINRAVDEARGDGYRLALAHVERAVYKGEDALFALLRSGLTPREEA
jgi:hypothetical protein